MPTVQDPSAELGPDDLNLLDPRALGLAAGLVVAATLFLATVTLLLHGGDPVGPNLALLSQYLLGYTVSWSGSLLGLGYGLIVGYLAGYVFARLRNRFIGGYLRHVLHRSEREEASDLLDRLS